MGRMRKMIKYLFQLNFAAMYVEWLRHLGMRIGERTTIFNFTSVLIDRTRPWLIEIGDDVQITYGVVILTHGYDWSVAKGKEGLVLGSAGKVKIGNNVFVGAKSTILKGVTIGNNVIIGAGSLVNKDVPDNCVVAGNPAQVVMTIDEYIQKRKQMQEKEAAELVREYRIVYGKDPDEKALSEFFFLFTNDDENLPKCWENKMNLLANRSLSADVLKKQKINYQNMEQFLANIE